MSTGDVITIGGIEMRKLYAPPRPFRLGTRRRRASGALLQAAGASRCRQAPASLDTDIQLATSDAEWLDSTRTDADLYQQSLAFHRELLSTYKRIYEKWRAKGESDPQLLEWWERYSREDRPRIGEDGTTRYKRVEKWLKANPPSGANAQAVKWGKKWQRLQHCQMEWVAYKPDCCSDRTRVTAVPVGCNDRLCPLCAWHRSQRARVKVRQLYDRLHHPVLITLTIPNIPTIRKKHIHYFRKMVRAWLAQNCWKPEQGRYGRIAGGVYSIECTFNRKQRTWHLHAHVLADMTTQLPTISDAKVDFFGEKVYPFTMLKWEWEFDWLNQCKDRWHAPLKTQQVSKGGLKWRLSWEHYRRAFRAWTLAKRAHSTDWAKRWHPLVRKRVLRGDLSSTEMTRYKQLERWNAQNTRVFHVEPVNDRDKAVMEVLKYLTKGALFSDIPEAVEEFAAAVQSARMVQTFGSWYGFQLDTAFDPEHLDDWGEMKCACGLNMWSRISGVFFKRDVEMDSSGRWQLKRPHDSNSRGTVPRPTIRALEARPSEGGEQWAR